MLIYVHEHYINAQEAACEGRLLRFPVLVLEQGVRICRAYIRLVCRAISSHAWPATWMMRQPCFLVHFRLEVLVDQLCLS